MADGTKIEWTDATWNPITGCSVVSPGCTNCYAMKWAGTRLKHHPSRAGLTRDSKAGPVWTGEVRFNPGWLDQPLRWKKPRMIFVCAHGDLFAEGVQDAWLDQIFAVMALAPQHTFQVLTKRPERMRDYLTCHRQELPGPMMAIIENARAMRPDDLYCLTEWPLPNVWLGVSVEDQKRAEERIPILLETPAAIRWISAEPLLGPIYIPEFMPNPLWNSLKSWEQPTLDWIVAGGESGGDARPMNPLWPRSLRDQCAAADIPYLFKQWGNFRPCSDANGPYMLRVTKAEAGRLLDGIEHNGFPEVSAHA
ncbi:phage Gp37/Gp68 family protein [Rhizobium sp. Root482]|uniref:phage Gp37/Gp68 family protein n=1 Tax=Rhizobium sp. Root482 TaxID=1736543 RepID=UPI0006FEE27F|nr:phage Gp37/Gp68 family protein [Rhizobium sp. Root482]KQY27212.1 hypothetical protein ASD31_03245 [Rhizobium sp. Root482]